MKPYPAPSAWKKITDRTGERGNRTVEWIPPDQQEADIRDILVQQTFYGTKQNPAQFLKSMFSMARGVCRAVRVNGPKEDRQNGFAVAYGQLYCAGQKGADKDVDTMIKVVRGNDALYVVQREFRRPAVAGTVPGVLAFDKDDQAGVRAHLDSMMTASRYTVEGAQLCPLAGGTGDCAAQK